jgi:hypothetical protein
MWEHNIILFPDSYIWIMVSDFARWCKSVRAAAWPGVSFANCSQWLYTGFPKSSLLGFTCCTFYFLFRLTFMMQETQNFGPLPLMHSALVACSLYLLTGCISSQWPDLVHVLLAHPKVQISLHDLIELLFIKIGFSLSSLFKVTVFVFMDFFFNFFLLYQISYDFTLFLMIICTLARFLFLLS